MAMTFDHDGEKMVEKSFSIVKTGHDIYSVSNASYHGYETNGIERESVDGKQLITRCYDSFIRRFSMFKGESDLSVFDNAASLKTLVDKFSDIHKFDGLVANTDSFEQKANKALLQEMKSDEVAKSNKIKRISRTRKMQSLLSHLTLTNLNKTKRLQKSIVISKNALKLRLQRKLSSWQQLRRKITIIVFLTNIGYWRHLEMS